MIRSQSLKRGLAISLFHFTILSSPLFGQIQETSGVEKSVQDSLGNVVNQERNSSGRTTFNYLPERVVIRDLKQTTSSSLAEMLKGRVSGLYNQTPTGEPGAYQNMLIRGIRSPQFNNKDIINNQAAIYVNGIPVPYESNFAYDIQRYDFNRIGPAIDYGNSIDFGSIKSIEIIKDPVRLAELGPLAVNGAIWITTVEPTSGKTQFSVNSYFGMGSKPIVTPINADYESQFRSTFYEKYATQEEIEKTPNYLKDKNSEVYYGPSNWRDLYYSNPISYNVDFNLSGGNQRANFTFYAGHTKNGSTADETQLKRYNVLFGIKMLPFTWLKASSYINARKLDRNRNKNIRDRLSEMDYIPDLSSPISPNKAAYGNMLAVYDELGLDDNNTNFIQGRLDIVADILRNLQFSTSFMLDYQEGNRNLFYPKALMDGVNYMSAYNGYTQRYVFSNKLKYNKVLAAGHDFYATVGSDYSEDLYRYLYSRVYNGPSDYIRKNIVSGQNEELTGNSALTTYRWNNRERFHLHSLYGQFEYVYQKKLSLKAILRSDGASTVQPDSRWLFSPAARIEYDLSKDLNSNEAFKLSYGFSRIGKPNFSSKFATGPQYQSDLGWQDNPSVFSYYGYATLSRGYSFGWVGYDLKWAYVDRHQVNVKKSFLQNRLNFDLSVYREETKNQITLVPIAQEYGYAGQFLNGLTVRNEGIDFSVQADIVRQKAADKGFGWVSYLSTNLNRNKVTALPSGLQEIENGGHLIKVGKPIDSFWLYENDGIFNSPSDVPVNPQTNLPLSYRGNAFSVGDAKWIDQNADYSITEDDKVLKGRFTPYFYGGFQNAFRYNKFTLDVSLAFSLGNKALNKRASNFYNFIEGPRQNDMGSVREIFQWQQEVETTNYPIYNVWSSTMPYQVNQDLFLEDASYLKLRSVSLGYDLASVFPQKARIKKSIIYLTANNLFTLTKFSGNDPEMVNFNGVYDGYGLPVTQSLIAGFRLDF